MTVGVFINDSSIVIDNSIERIFYNVNTITVPNKAKSEEIIKRNNTKSTKIINLVKAPFTLSTIPYNVYIFSCNPDYVIYKLHNIEDEGKCSKADEFATSIMTNDELLHFFNKQAFWDAETYEESCDFICTGDNSLSRASNFVFFFKKSLLP